MTSYESTKIIRFIPNPDQSEVFDYRLIRSDDSTFVMRSLDHYRNTEFNRTSDVNELHVRLIINGELTDREDIQPQFITVSCWSLLDKIDIDTLANRFLWDGSKLSGVAIISRINKVETLIRNITERFNQPSNRYEHHSIRYYDETTRLDIDPNLIDRTIRFMKRRHEFEIEQEYRFIFDIIQLGNNFTIPSIYRVRSTDYIEEIIGFGETNLPLMEYCEQRGIIFTIFGNNP